MVAVIALVVIFVFLFIYVAAGVRIVRPYQRGIVEQLGKFADRQLHRTQQRKDAQPRRIGQRLE